MRTFNLQEALAGRPVVTRAGEAVTDLRYYHSATGLAKISAVAGELLYTYCASGRYSSSKDVEYTQDLFMKSEKIVRWVNLYRIGQDPSHRHYAYAYESQSLADGAHASMPDKRLGDRAFRVEWEA